MNPDERKEPPCVHTYIVTEWKKNYMTARVDEGFRATTPTCSKCLETKSL